MTTTSSVEMTISTFGPDGAVFLAPTTSTCPDTWREELAKKRRNRNLAEIAGGFEFDSYCPGYWDHQEDAEYMQAIRTRVTFTSKEI